MNSEYIVEMRNITKSFPGIIANDDVTIQVRKGEVYALLGENGAGKSTLMSMLYGMYEPDRGEIYIRGEKVVFKSPSEAAEKNIGMVHQHFKLVDNYTIGENIVLGIEPMKKKFGIFPYVDMKEANEKIAKLSKDYGLEVNPTDLIDPQDALPRSGNPDLRRADSYPYTAGDRVPPEDHGGAQEGRQDDHPHHP